MHRLDGLFDLSIWRISVRYLKFNMSYTELLIAHLIETAFPSIFHLAIYLVAPAEGLGVIHHSCFPYYLTLTQLTN